MKRLKHSQKELGKKRTRRVRRIRAKLFGSAEKPRLSIFRSNKQVWVELIDDEKGHTLAASHGRLKDALRAGEEIAKLALLKGIKNVIFDKGRYAYHGHVKEVAQGARKGGLKF